MWSRSASTSRASSSPKSDICRAAPALVDAQAATEVEALLIPPDGLRRLIIAEAELGEKIMRALILRRVALIENATSAQVLIGPALNPDMVRLQNFLARNGYPHQTLDPDEDADAQALIERYAPDPSDLPLAVCADGTVLKNPSTTRLAYCLGMVTCDAPDRTYDVAIVGAGPAGLATAVYAASEGLSVIMFDAKAFRGQAGASARIENYLGFPAGISGQALTGRAFVQAQKFGAEAVIPMEVTGLDCGVTPFSLRLANGTSVKAQAVVVAAGARYRRPAIPPPARLRGARHLVLGLPHRGADVTARGDCACGGRQFGWPGGCLSLRLCRQNFHAGPGGKSCGIDVALSDRPDRGTAEH
jgi:thioredoxin reductase (NADPH)